MVDVLIFVHQNVAKFVLVVLSRVLALLQQADGVQDQVVEVQGTVEFEFLLIQRVDLADDVLEQARKVTREFVGLDEFLLGLGDHRQDRARGVLPVVEVQLVQALLDQRQLIAVVIHDEVLLQANRRTALTQQAGADGVERPHPHLLARHFANELRQPLAHLVRGLVRKRDRQNVARPHAPPPGQERDAVRQDARLTEPAPAKISSGPSECTTASRCDAFKPCSSGSSSSTVKGAGVHSEAEVVARARRALSVSSSAKGFGSIRKL